MLTGRATSAAHPAPNSATSGDYLSAVSNAIAAVDRTAMARIAARLHASDLAGGTVYWLGNGGSAATATHLSSDLARLTMVPGLLRQFRSVSLAANMALLTACANDHGFEHVFLEQLRHVVRRTDVVIGVSTSGASPNVLNAVRYARAAGAFTVGMTGLAGTTLQACADDALVVPSSDIQVVEDATLAVGHAVCLLTRRLRASETG